MPTVELLMHQNGSLATQHYVGYTSLTEAEKFYGLTPDSVAPPPDLLPDRRCKVSIPKEELARLMREMTITEIARKMGCSDTAVSRACKRLGITRPGQGHWVTRNNADPSPDNCGAEKAIVHQERATKIEKNVVTQPVVSVKFRTFDGRVARRKVMG